MLGTKFIEIHANGQTDLSRIASLFTDHSNDLIQKFADFALIEGASSFLGSGDPKIETIRIEIDYNNCDQATLDEVDRILATIQRADDVSIEIATS